MSRIEEDRFIIVEEPANSGIEYIIDTDSNTQLALWEVCEMLNNIWVKLNTPIQLKRKG